MHAPHLDSHRQPDAPEARAGGLRRRRGAALWPALALLALSVPGLALVAGCGPQGSQTAGGAEAEDRFEFIRARVGIVRTDTRTGQVWTTPINGDGGWQLRGAAPDLAGRPARDGRFQVMNIAVSRNTVRLGPDSGTPALIRVDRDTGASWLLESEEAQSWTEIRDAGQPPVARPEGGGSSGGAAPQAASGRDMPSSKMLDESSSEEYPILTGDQLGTTLEEKQKTLQTLRTARSKAELPLKMRRWAVRQLGELDPDLAVPELLLVLNDPEPELAAEAVRQLGHIGRASTIPQILKLQGHPDPRVRDAVAEVVVEVQ